MSQTQTAVPLVLTDEDRAELARWSDGSSPMLAERARIVLACAEPGSGVAREAAELGSTSMTVRKWRRRFAEDGLAGLGRLRQLAVGPWRNAGPNRCCAVQSAGCVPGGVACWQLIGAPSGRSGYDCSVEGSRGEAGGSLRLAAALIPASLGALVCGRSGVARGCAGSRVRAGRFAGYSGDAWPLAVSV